jgi:hypothetical protein
MFITFFYSDRLWLYVISIHYIWEAPLQSFTIVYPCSHCPYMHTTMKRVLTNKHMYFREEGVGSLVIICYCICIINNFKLNLSWWDCLDLKPEIVSFYYLTSVYYDTNIFVLHTLVTWNNYIYLDKDSYMLQITFYCTLIFSIIFSRIF